MANYVKMTTYELEQERSKLQDKMMSSNDDAEIELLSMEIEGVTDILDSCDPLADE